MELSLLTPQQCDLLSSEIRAAGRIVVCCHQSPDGDAVGSCLAWADYLRHQGKEPSVIVPDQYPDFLRWMPNTEKVVRYDKNKDAADALIAAAELIFFLDLGELSRTGAMAESLSRAEGHRIVIDHHLDPTMEGVSLMISFPELSSTSEIVFRIVYQLGGFPTLGTHFAAPLYCGMMTDTGGFTYNSNRPEIYMIVSLLLTKGIDKDKIYRNVYNNYRESRLRLIGYVLYCKLKYFPELNASYFALTREDMRHFHFIKGDAEGLVNMPLQIKGMRLSISLREDTEKPNLVHISLRSVDDFPCNAMAAEFFNGGGHLNASGGRLHCSIDEAQQVVRRAMEAYKSKLK